MKRCSIVDCYDLVMENSLMTACALHEEMLIEHYREERSAYEDELWRDYQDMIRDGMNAGNAFGSGGLEC